jgi:AraC-like DNA-binding protein
MTKNQTDENLVLDNPLTQRSEQCAYRQVLESIRQRIPASEVVVLTSLPRGTLQIAQPARVPELLLKAYAREAYPYDRLSWGAMLQQRTLRGADVWREAHESDPFYTAYLRPAGLRYAVAAPLKAPALEGYPGAIHLYRSPEQGAFTSQETQELSRFAGEIDAAVEKSRHARRSGACRLDDAASAWAQRPQTRLFIVDSSLRSHPEGDELNVLDERLRQQIVQHARHRFQHVNGEAMSSDRLHLPDGAGGLGTFRVITHRQFPAIGNGPFVFFCLQPDCCDWGLLRSADFQADKELARLIPAMRFMQQEFSRSPSLREISKQVHLSPFHFHRRFTELLGLTPKHFLLDCQIFEAKRQLIERRKDLAQIATDCGFAHQSHFTSRFKQATGLTPTRWRKLFSA